MKNGQRFERAGWIQSPRQKYRKGFKKRGHSRGADVFCADHRMLLKRTHCLCFQRRTEQRGRRPVTAHYHRRNNVNLKTTLGLVRLKKNSTPPLKKREWLFTRTLCTRKAKKKKEKEIISNQRCCLVWQNTLTHQANSHKQSKNKGSSRHTFGVLISTLPSLTSGLCPGMTWRQIGAEEAHTQIRTHRLPHNYLSTYKRSIHSDQSGNCLNGLWVLATWSGRKVKDSKDEMVDIQLNKNTLKIIKSCPHVCESLLYIHCIMVI